MVLLKLPGDHVAQVVKYAFEGSQSVKQRQRVPVNPMGMQLTELAAKSDDYI